MQHSILQCNIMTFAGVNTPIKMKSCKCCLHHLRCIHSELGYFIKISFAILRRIASQLLAIFKITLRFAKSNSDLAVYHKRYSMFDRSSVWQELAAINQLENLNHLAKSHELKYCISLAFKFSKYLSFIIYNEFKII